MVNHPFHDVAIVGVHNTTQSRVLEDHDSVSIAMEAALGAVADAGLSPRDIDGVVGPDAAHFIYQARIGPVWSVQMIGIPAVLAAASAVVTGMATTVLVTDGGAGKYRDRGATAPWTRPANEFTMSYGMFTAAEFALVARRHMHMYGTRPEQLATVSATIRNNGSVNPDAVYYGRGPFTVDDILNSRMVADPFHLLDCATTSEGGSALVVTGANLSGDRPKSPVYVLGGNGDRFGPGYHHPPSFDLGGKRRPDLIDGWVGRRAAESCWKMSGLGPSDVDVCEFYDPFSFEIIRQFEAFGFCGEGEGGDFVMDGRIEVGGEYPVTTDGGTMSFSHVGSAQMLQRVIRCVQQLRGECTTGQVEGAEVAMCTGSGSGALSNDVLLLGSSQP